VIPSLRENLKIQNPDARTSSKPEMTPQLSVDTQAPGIAASFGPNPASHIDMLPYKRDPHALHMLKLMATCHSIKKVNGRLLGDYLDLSMLEFTGWTLEELTDSDESIVPTILKPPEEQLLPDTATIDSNRSDRPLLDDQENDHATGLDLNQDATPPTIEELGIIKTFEFSAELRRMSVIVRNVSAPDRNPIVYTKGSPETICSICDPMTSKFLRLCLGAPWISNCLRA
jgi:magnesium-transporting ATPase (P-type)